MSYFEKITECPASIPLPHEHYVIRAIKLVTNTDENDTLIQEAEARIFNAQTRELHGHIFVASDMHNKVSTVLIVPAPDYAMPSVKVEKLSLIIDSCSYPVYRAETPIGETERAVRSWYRERYSPSVLHAMSNTWGDRNGRTRVSDEFLRREIDSGADLGLDVVQIDDGWQVGVPDDYDEIIERSFDGDFWELREERFPHGMEALTEYAHKKGVELGLWFAPHSKGMFEHFERDLDVLKKAYVEWGMRYFKLDMLRLSTRERCDKMSEFLEKLSAFGKDVSVELDVTADKRLGYLAPAPFGTIFVENRYTAWSNYYPHRTLRNLWMLSRFIPASKCQFELVNPELYTEKYDKNDVYRHETYSIDYLFASVMLSNPLFWMETQFLSQSARQSLKSIISIWKRYRGELTLADVYPIGEEPSGASLTGFVAECDNSVHILLFREVTERDTLTVTIDKSIGGVELIKESSPSSFIYTDGKITAKLCTPRSYLWLRAEKANKGKKHQKAN